VGFHFFRKTGLVLGLDFSVPTVTFIQEAPEEGVTVGFHAPPDHLSHFDSAFIEVEVSAGGTARTLVALLDTGANATVMRRELADPTLTAVVGGFGAITATVAHERLGVVAVDVGLFDNTHLPDMILGTDAMAAWGDRWFFSFAQVGGTVTVVADNVGTDLADNAPGLQATQRVPYPRRNIHTSTSGR